MRAGVGRLRLVDRDYVDESNLQRQSLYDERDLAEGLPKAVAAERKLRTINGDVEVESRVEDVNAGNVLALFDGIDLVLDGTDNFETRYLLNDASIRTRVPWIYAGVVGASPHVDAVATVGPDPLRHRHFPLPVHEVAALLDVQLHVDPDAVEQWDSEKHVALVVALEDRFGCMFEAEEVPELTSLERMEEIIARHGDA